MSPPPSRIADTFLALRTALCSSHFRLACAAVACASGVFALSPDESTAEGECNALPAELSNAQSETALEVVECAMESVFGGALDAVRGALGDPSVQAAALAAAGNLAMHDVMVMDEQKVADSAESPAVDRHDKGSITDDATEVAYQKWVAEKTSVYANRFGSDVKVSFGRDRNECLQHLKKFVGENRFAGYPNPDDNERVIFLTGKMRVLTPGARVQPPYVGDVVVLVHPSELKPKAD